MISAEHGFAAQRDGVEVGQDQRRPAPANVQPSSVGIEELSSIRLNGSDSIFYFFWKLELKRRSFIANKGYFSLLSVILELFHIRLFGHKCVQWNR